jgi:secondary thiamine-phosphate synthase enzyme
MVARFQQLSNRHAPDRQAGRLGGRRNQELLPSQGARARRLHGLGNALIAAERHSRGARGIELGRGYVGVAVRRWQVYTGMQGVEGKPMKSFRKELWFETPERRAFLNITPQVKAALKESDVQEGIALINAMHITASVFINDDEQGLHTDYEAWLERLAPHEPVSGYRHNRTGEDNADAHMKRQIMGREVVVAITAGKLDFGPWEQIFYGEFDGGRRKRVLIKIIGE